MEAMPSIPLGRASFPGTPIHLRIVESVVHSIVACSLLSFVPTQPRFTTRSFMSAGSNRARCRETCSGSRKLKRPAPLCVAVRKRCFYVWLVQVPPGRRTTVGHAVRRTSPLISTLATAAAEKKCSLTRNCFRSDEMANCLLSPILLGKLFQSLASSGCWHRYNTHDAAVMLNKSCGSVCIPM